MNISEILPIVKWPLIASILLPWLLVYLGLHIVQRGVIFVDLALAQVAAFGTCAAMLAGYDLHDWQSFAFSMGATLLGAALLTFTRTRQQRVPQEALIGIVYVMAAAASILALSKTAGGGKEELQRSLVGELLVVPPSEVIRTAILFLAVGLTHYLFRKQFMALSETVHGSETLTLKTRWWDFLFYMLFGVVVTSFVHIGGVLLVFSYLVIPAVCASFLVTGMRARFAVGWFVATVGSVASILLAVSADLPIGAATVCSLGLCLLVVILLLPFLSKRKRSGGQLG